MYISWTNYEKFLEACSTIETYPLISISDIVEISEKIHIDPLKRSIVRYIVNHPKKMQQRFGFTIIQSI